MTKEKHDEIMTNIMKQLDQDDLDLGDGIAIWHSLGRFLFSHLDTKNTDISKVYKEMNNYLSEMEKMTTKSN